MQEKELFLASDLPSKLLLGYVAKCPWMCTGLKVVVLKTLKNLIVAEEASKEELQSR